MLLRIHESTQAKITTFNMILWPPLHTMIKHAELRIYHTEWAEHKIKARRWDGDGEERIFTYKQCIKISSSNSSCSAGRPYVNETTSNGVRIQHRLS